MVLTSEEESLIHIIRALPPQEASKVLDWARQLSDLADGRPIEWSDSWSDDYIADATAASLRNLEDEERQGH